MGLYRQIAGAGMPNQVGYFTLSNMFSATRDAISPYLNTEQTVDVSDTGGISPYDPKANFDPDSVNLDTFPTPIPLPEGVNPLPPIRPSQPLPPETSIPLPTDTNTALKNNILPLLALAGVMLVAVTGEQLLHSNRKIALVGGLGLLYYGMAKNKLV
jgi:hypothetical protein